MVWLIPGYPDCHMKVGSQGSWECTVSIISLPGPGPDHLLTVLSLGRIQLLPRQSNSEHKNGVSRVLPAVGLDTHLLWGWLHPAAAVCSDPILSVAWALGAWGLRRATQRLAVQGERGAEGSQCPMWSTGKMSCPRLPGQCQGVQASAQSRVSVSEFSAEPHFSSAGLRGEVGLGVGYLLMKMKSRGI